WVVDVGDVLDVPDLAAGIPPGPHEEVEAEVGVGVAGVGGVVGGDPADVEGGRALDRRLDQLPRAGVSEVDLGPSSGELGDAGGRPGTHDAQPSPSAALDRHPDPVAPRVLDLERAAVVGELQAAGAQPVLQRPEVVVLGQDDVDDAQAQGGDAGPGARAVPRVHRHVVVVAARGDEQRAGHLQGGLEAEGVDVELLRRGRVADLEVDVADDGRVLGGPTEAVHAQVV